MFLKSQMLMVLLLFITGATFSQSKGTIIPESYIAYHTAQPIEVDGKDADPSWNKVEWTNLFIDIEGVKKPKYNTQVKMLWDQTYFYILAKMEEPHVWADITEHDAIIFHNNDFEVFVDPDGDTFNYYEIEVNAFNTVWDLFVSKPYRENNVVLNDWTATGMKSAVSIDGTLNNPKDVDKGWTLEMAIPWSVYKKAYFEDNVPKDKFWRVNFSRVNWNHEITDGKYGRKKDVKGNYLPEYNWVWSPQGVINMHEPEKWGYVYFSSEEAGGKAEFEIPQDEKIKWELFSLHRAQKTYFEAHKTYADALTDLSAAPMVIDGKTVTPKLEHHRFGWTISAKSPFSEKTLIVDETGRFSLQ